MPAICTTSFVCSLPEIVRKVIRLSPRSPNLNAYAERFVRSIKDECLNRMIFVGQALLRRAVSEYMAHYHGERNHQGLDQPVNCRSQGLNHRARGCKLSMDLGWCLA